VKIALDFDGVLHSYSSGWTGVIPFDPPVRDLGGMKAQDFCQALLDKNHEIVVHTCRADTDNGKAVVRDYLRHHKFPKIMWGPVYAEGGVLIGYECEITDRKPRADVYIDDRGLRFEGDFKNALLALQAAARPWHKDRV
jgi:hypothetical protein